MARFGADGGFVATAQKTTESAGELARTTTGTVQELEPTLRDLDDAARAIRDLAQDIDRDPDMLLKGRGAEGPPVRRFALLLWSLASGCALFPKGAAVENRYFSPKGSPTPRLRAPLRRRARCCGSVG